MPDINIQFHATTEEIAKLVRAAVESGSVHLVAISLQPFVATLVHSHDIESAVEDSSVDRLCFLISEPALDVKSKPDFDKSNNDQLVLDVGRVSLDGLSQSWLACRTENGEALRIWRRIAKDITNLTKPGVTCINRHNGASHLEKSFRYTEGAKQLESSGVMMLPPQGAQGPRLRLGEIGAI